MTTDPCTATETADRYHRGLAPTHETDHSVVSSPTIGDGRPIAETGTTIVGLSTGDGVVMAADRRASAGGRFVTSKRFRKIEAVHPSAVVAVSGAVGHAQHFARTLRAEGKLYAYRRGEELTMGALSTVAGNVLRTAPLYVTPLLGGVDEEGARVFGLDGGGGVLSDAYVAGGSGMQVAYGVLEREYDADLSIDEARSVAVRAVDSASERDTASGNGFTVGTVTAESVRLDEYDAIEEVD